MLMTAPALGALLYAFFVDHLTTLKGLRPASVQSYRTLRLFPALRRDRSRRPDHAPRSGRPEFRARPRLPPPSRSRPAQSHSDAQSASRGAPHVLTAAYPASPTNSHVARGDISLPRLLGRWAQIAVLILRLGTHPARRSGAARSPRSARGPLR